MGQGAGSRVGTGRFQAMGHKLIQPVQPPYPGFVDLRQVREERVGGARSEHPGA
jgi:hypothetical protein